jgi:TolA-binding protein
MCTFQKPPGIKVPEFLNLPRRFFAGTAGSRQNPMTFNLKFSKITILMIGRISIHMFQLMAAVLILSATVPVSVHGASGGLDDQLRLIRGGFEDGLYDLVYPEALLFLENAGNHKARGEVFLILGFIEKSRRNMDRARHYFQKATMSDDPEIRLQGYYQEASIAWSRSDYVTAADLFQAILDENRGGGITEQSLYWLILSLFRSQQFEEVIRIVTDTAEQGSGLDGEKLLHLIFCRGQAYFRTGLWNEAATDLETVYAADTDQIKADAALILARIHLGQDNPAMADMWAAKRLESGYNRDAYRIRAAYALEYNDYACARQHFLSIVQDVDLEPLDQDLYRWKIALCESKIASEDSWWIPLLDFCRDHTESAFSGDALSEFLRRSEASPLPGESVRILETCRDWDAVHHGMQLAQLHLVNNAYDPALSWIVRHFNQGDAARPDTNTRLLIARLLAASGDPESASAEMLRLDIPGDRAVDDVDTLLQRAELFLQSGMYQQAASMFQHIVVSPGSDEDTKKTALFRLGNAYFQMEQWLFAGDIFNRFLETWPGANAVLREAAMRRYALSCIYAREWERSENAIEVYLANFGETEFRGEMYYLRGLAEANQGKTGPALQSMGLALDHLSETDYIETVKTSIRQLTDYQNGMNEAEQ